MNSWWFPSHILIALLCSVNTSADPGMKSIPSEAKAPRPHVAIAARTNALGDGGRVSFVPLLALLAGEESAWRDTLLAEPSPHSDVAYEYESMRKRFSRELDSLALVAPGMETRAAYETRRKRAESEFIGRFASVRGQVDTIGALRMSLQEYDPETEVALVSVTAEKMDLPVWMLDCVLCSDRGDTTGFSGVSRTTWLDLYGNAVFARVMVPRGTLREAFPGDDWRISGVAIPGWTARIRLSWSLMSQRMPRTVAEKRAEKPGVFRYVEGVCCRVSEFTILNSSGEAISSIEAQCR